MLSSLGFADGSLMDRSYRCGKEWIGGALLGDRPADKEAEADAALTLRSAGD